MIVFLVLLEGDLNIKWRGQQARGVDPGLVVSLKTGHGFYAHTVAQ